MITPEKEKNPFCSGVSIFSFSFNFYSAIDNVHIDYNIIRLYLKMTQIMLKVIVNKNLQPTIVF